MFPNSKYSQKWSYFFLSFNKGTTFIIKLVQELLSVQCRIASRKALDLSEIEIQFNIESSHFTKSTDTTNNFGLLLRRQPN